MTKGEVIYEGKAKIMYATDEPDKCIVYFKDDATAGNGEKHGFIQDKGIINNKISTYFFKLLKTNGIDSHFIDMISDREMVVKMLRMISLEVVVRNVAAGSLAKRLGLEEGTPLKVPVLEYFYKSDDLGDPMLNRYHIMAVDIARVHELDEIEHIAFCVNTILKNNLRSKNVDLIDFKLEFGRDEKDRIVLADEISPDNCRFWDMATHEKLDKDRFRHDMGGVEEAYKEMLNRLTM
ncbi:MAG: phosphoribosylaminoimidazolesuccinocarboxamide synthase [Selenomonadaceae bacterium]|nr:phosphoribosylaminoimidazolesuccinocarboxamide synthase [Selenomonadaceae bacterium]